MSILPRNVPAILPRLALTPSFPCGGNPGLNRSPASGNGFAFMFDTRCWQQRPLLLAAGTCLPNCACHAPLRTMSSGSFSRSSPNLMRMCWSPEASNGRNGHESHCSRIGASKSDSRYNNANQPSCGRPGVERLPASGIAGGAEVALSVLL